MLRRRRPLRPEESVGVRLAVFSSIAIATAGLGIFGGVGPLAVFCMAVAAAGHRWSWRHRHRAPRRGVRILVGLGMGAATVLLLAELFLDVGADPFPQGTFLLLLMAITSFDVRSRTNCYSSVVFGLLGVYACASIAYDDTMIGLVVAFSLSVLSTLALACRADALQRTLHLDPVNSVTTEPARGQGTQERARAGRGRLVRPLVGFGAAVALGAAVAYAALPPYEGILPIYPVSADLQASTSFSGEVLNPLLPLISTRSPSGPRSGYYGFGSELPLGRYGPLDRTVLMHVRATGWSYWRMETFDTYTGRSWQAATGLLNELARDADGSITPLVYPLDDGDYHPQNEVGGGATATTIRQTFTMVHDGPNLIAAAYRPIKLYFPSTTIWQRVNADDLIADQPLQAGATYSVISQLPDTRPSVLRTAQGPDPRTATIDLALPPVAPSVVAAAHQATAGGRTRYDQVMSIIAYLAAHAHYDLDTPALPSGAEAVATLLATGRGYCEQFATALTVLARLNSIPARLVTGFVPGDYNPISEVYTVRASDAHAWTEIFFPGQGWLPFDATPSSPAQPQPHTTATWLLGNLMASHSLPRPNWAGLTQSGGMIASESGVWLRQRFNQMIAVFFGSAGYDRQAGILLLVFLLVVLLGAIVVMMQGRRGRLQLPWQSKHAAGKTSRQAVLRIYTEAECALQRRGYPPRAGAVTPQRYAHQLAGASEDERMSALTMLAELAMAAAYGAQEMTTDDVAAAHRLSRTIKGRGSPGNAP